jgi:hypothetical protein
MGELIQITRSKRLKYKIKRGLSLQIDSSLELIYYALFFGFFIGMAVVIIPIVILSAIMSFPIFPFLKGIENNRFRVKTEEKDDPSRLIKIVRP